MDASALARPGPRLGDVSSTLFDFAITTFDVGVGALARHLPRGLAPERFRLDDGRERAMVSAVTFLNTRFFVHFAPFVRLTCEQTNYRAYVRREGVRPGGERAVWFFGTALAHPLVYLPRLAWQLPWHRARVRRTSAWEGDRLRHLRWHAEAPGAEERLVAEGTGRPLGRLDGFSGASDTHEILTHPLVGYVWRRDGRVATYGVWHAPLQMEEASAKEVRFERFEALGLVEPGARPHSVLVQRTTEFLVRLPPRRVRALEGEA